MLTLFVFLSGLAVGSFVNVVIHRLPAGRTLGGRSFCPKCGRKILWFDLAPLISFGILGGKCRFCRQPISWLYFLIELYSGFIFLASFLLFFNRGLGYWLFSVFLLEVFLVILVIDLQHLIIPDELLITGLIGALIYGLAEYLALVPASYQIISVGNFLSALILALFLSIPWLISKGTWLGFGDIKLISLVGFIFSLASGLLILYLAVFLGALISFVLLALKKASLKTKLPLGSFVAIAVCFHIFLGNAIINESNWLRTILGFFL